VNRIGKWCGVAVLLVVMATTAFGAAVTEIEYRARANTYTVDAQKSGTWDSLASLIVVASDTGALYVSIQGTAVMDPGDKLYVGFACHQAVGAAAPNIDTFTVAAPRGVTGKQYIPFFFEYMVCDTVSTATGLGDPFLGYIGAVTDTVKFRGACGGSTTKEYVELENVTYTAMIRARGDCFTTNGAAKTYKR
jgi:hypothetical protein